MIKWLDIKETFRNRRFILFTLIFPLGWYIMIINISRAAKFFDVSNGALWFVVACVIGIAGNSIVTFSKKISETQQFYRLQSKTSHYAMKHWLLDQVVVQSVLNLSICAVNVLVGSLLKAITVNLSLLVLIILILGLGLYLSVIGFLIGILVDGDTISALSMPLSMGFGVLMIRWDTFMSGNGPLIESINFFQQFFPRYYLFDIVQKMMNHQRWEVSLAKYLLSLLLIIVVIALLFSWQQRKIKHLKTIHVDM
ncbi:multidrug ABC transporter permease [Leuconostoc citreum]